MSSLLWKDEPSPLPGGRVEAPRRSWTASDRFARHLVFRTLSGIEVGLVEVRDAEGSGTFGRAGSDLPKVTVEVHSPDFYRRVLRSGANGGGEAWIEGEWSCNDLSAALRLVLRNAEVGEGLERGLALLARPALALLRRSMRNTREGSRRNISAHYDLSNDFFRIFLDPTLTYSSGYFERSDATMQEASIAKIDRLCRQLGLRPGHHLLEIGTGWGALAVHAAEHYGCRVTTTTISREQHAVAAERIAAAGLQDRVELLLEDYRDLRGRYDRLVSVEMIEAVGAEYFGTFFRKCSGLLQRDGAMALQAITIDDRHFERASRSVDFIKKYVFPGGCLPSVDAISGHLRTSTDMRIAHLTSMTAHYAETLRRWRATLAGDVEACRALGLDGRFLRLWEYYLCYCEAGFEERHIGCVQILAAKPGYRESLDVAPAPIARAWGA